MPVQRLQGELWCLTHGSSDPYQRGELRPEPVGHEKEQRDRDQGFYPLPTQPSWALHGVTVGGRRGLPRRMWWVVFLGSHVDVIPGRPRRVPVRVS